MNEINCEICMDLMPLVQDGVASAGSIEAVERHILHCPACRELFEGQMPMPSDKAQVLEKLKRRLQLGSAMALIFGIMFGLSLTAGNSIFYNVIIMPIIGAVGYYVFRWKSVFLVPGLLFVMHLATNAMGLGAEYLMLPTLLMWTGLYSLFALVGIIIAALIRFAFSKEDE